MDKREAIEMLELCGMSYCDVQPKIKNQDLTFINDKKTDVQCFVRKEGNKLVIVFRGSDSRKDWTADFNFRKKAIPYDEMTDIKVHAGFLGTYKSPDVRGRIQSFVTDEIEKIQITGHSYGAALAVLCAVDLNYNFSEKDYDVLLFGCPRVGNEAFKKYYNKRLFKTLRFENEYDLITKVPFSIFGYRHVGTKIKLGRRGLYKIFSMRYHKLQKYYSNIWKW